MADRYCPIDNSLMHRSDPLIFEVDPSKAEIHDEYLCNKCGFIYSGPDTASSLERAALEYIKKHGKRYLKPKKEKTRLKDCFSRLLAKKEET